MNNGFFVWAVIFAAGTGAGAGVLIFGAVDSRAFLLGMVATNAICAVHALVRSLRP